MEAESEKEQGNKGEGEEMSPSSAVPPSEAPLPSSGAPTPSEAPPPSGNPPAPGGGPPPAPGPRSWLRPEILIPALGLLLSIVIYVTVTLQDSRLERIRATENALHITQTVQARGTEAAIAGRTPTPTARPLSDSPRVIAYHFVGESPGLDSEADQAGLRGMGEQNWRVYQSEFYEAMAEKYAAGELPGDTRFLFFAFRNVGGGQASEVRVEAIEWAARLSSGLGEGVIATPGLDSSLDSGLSSVFEGNNRWVDPATGEEYDLGEGLSLPARTQEGEDRALFLLVDAASGISAFDPLIENANARLICVLHSYTDLDLNVHNPDFNLPTCLGEQVAGTRISNPLTVNPFP